MAMVAAAVLALALASPSPADARVTLNGVGPLRIGMSVEALRSRFGATLEEEPDPEVDCAYWTSPRFPGLAMMVSSRRLVRIDFDDARWRTASGAGVGMSEREVRALYGRQLRVDEHPYTGPEGHYLIYRARSEPLGMIFETDGRRVERYRVGYWNKVQLIEGCL